MGTPPRYGDYEAQRHWMEITTNTPPAECWTVESYWTQTCIMVRAVGGTGHATAEAVEQGGFWGGATVAGSRGHVLHETLRPEGG